MAGLDPAIGLLSGGLGILKYWWVVAILAVLAIIGFCAWYFKLWRKKEEQWTHKLNVTIELANGELDSRVLVHNMRRWKHKDENTPPLFELERPLIGSRIFVELEKYSGATSYDVVLGNDGRIYIPTKTIMCRDKNAKEVSVKHAGIDRARQHYTNRFEQMNATPSKIDGLTLLKYGLWGLIIIATMVVCITGLKEWGENAGFDAQEQQLKLQTWEQMNDVMITVESVLNTQALIIPDLKDKYGNNLQAAIKNSKDVNDEI